VVGFFNYQTTLDIRMASIFKVAVVCSTLAVSASAFAQKAGDNVVSLGLVSIRPATHVGPLSNSVGGAAQFAVNGATASVSRETTVNASWLRMYTDQVGVELSLGMPTTLTQDLTTPATGAHPAAARMTLRAPAVLGKYFLGVSQDAWRPYVGLGVAHVSFHHVQTNTADAVVQNLGGVDASFRSTWTPIYNAGMIKNMDDRWHVDASVSYLPVKTTVTFVGQPGYGNTTGDIKLNTTTYAIRVGYRF
jgi:outer membrane protein